MTQDSGLKKILTSLTKFLYVVLLVPAVLLLLFGLYLLITSGQRFTGPMPWWHFIILMSFVFWIVGSLSFYAHRRLRGGRKVSE